jgi:hypothetical protein
VNLPGHAGDRARAVGRVDRRESENQGSGRGETTTAVARRVAVRWGVRRRAGKRSRDASREGGDQGAETRDTPYGHVNKNREDACRRDDRYDVTCLVTGKDRGAVLTRTGASVPKTPPPAHSKWEAHGPPEKKQE